MKPPQPTPPAAPSAEASSAEVFLLELGRALHAYGTPAHRLEDVLTGVARQLGLESQFYSTPTALLVSLGPLGEQHSSLLRVDPGEINLKKLAALDDVIVAMAEEGLTPAQARAQVQRIVAEPPPYRRPVLSAAYAVVGACIAAVFGGGLADVAVAGVIGLVVGIIAVGSERLPARLRIHELLAASLAAFLGELAVFLGAPVSAFIVALSGLIVLVPGFTLTVAMTELATRNLVSGTARLTAAGIVFLELAFGVALGSRLAALILGPSPSPTLVPLPGWAEPVVLVVLAFGLTVVFQASLRRVGWILLAGVVAFYGSRLGAVWLGSAMGASVGAFAATLVANAYGRLLNRTAFVPLAPAILLLVPGSLGYRSLSSLMDNDVLRGVDFAFEASLVAVSIVAGLLAAYAVYSPRRPL